jgi:hypothetical protein
MIEIATGMEQQAILNERNEFAAKEIAELEKERAEFGLNWRNENSRGDSYAGTTICPS